VLANSEERILIAKIVISAAVIAFVIANTIWRGPKVDTVDDNSLVYVHPCTEYSIGWPLPYFHKYPQGWLSPWEPMILEARPAQSFFDVIGFLFDDLCGAFLTWCVCSLWRNAGIINKLLRNNSHHDDMSRLSRASTTSAPTPLVPPPN